MGYFTYTCYMYLKQPMLTVIFPFAMARKVAEDLVVALRRRAEQESEAHAACLRESRSLEFAENSRCQLPVPAIQPHFTRIQTLRCQVLSICFLCAF